ncbi:MAG: hypothetical protein V4608_01395 [Bacteroidota bacterium]
MKRQYVTTIALSAFLFIVGLTTIHAQDTPFLQFGGKPAQDTVVAKKLTAWEYLTKTPWIIQVGPDVVNDNNTRLKEFKLYDNRNFYPIHTSAEKRLKALKGKLGLQVVLSSETINKHYFWSSDLNVKYNVLTNSIGDTKMFDPYVFLGLGHTYRDFPHGQYTATGKDNSMNLNVGLGANLWVFKNAGIYLQAVPKWVLFKKQWEGSNYIQFSAGIAFKIGNSGYVAKVEEIKTVAPSTYKRSKEAEDAAKYLRDILDKK